MARRRVRPQPPRPGPATPGSPGPVGGHGPSGSCAGRSPEPALAKAGGGGLTRVCKGVSGRRMGDDLQVRLGLWPGFGQQPDAAPEPALEEQPPEPVDAVPDYAYGAARPAPGVAMYESWRLGWCAQVAWGNSAVVGVFHPGAVGQGQQGGHSQHQPVAGDTGRVGAAGLVPLPTQALDGPPVVAEGRL